MAATEFEKLKGLISAIEEGNYSNVEAAINAAVIENGRKECYIINLENGKIPLHVALRQSNPNIKIIKLLLENGADPGMENSDGENAWCVAIKNRKLKGIFSEQAEFQLSKALDISYRYSGPLNDTKRKVNRDGDNYLHIAARAGNINAFMYIFKESIEKNVRLLEYNENHENPLHIAARMGILRVIVKGMFEHFELTASDKIKTLENSIGVVKRDVFVTRGSKCGDVSVSSVEVLTKEQKEFRAELREVKEKLKNDKSYIVESLRNKCALNEKKKTPLDCVSKTEKEDVKKAAGIQDKLICNKNFHLSLYIAGAIACTVALCMSLYFLFLVSQTFALSSMVAMASGGAACLLFKACSEIYNLHNDGLSDVEIMQLSESIGVTA